MFFGSKNLIGLDIGSSTIKIAEVSLSRSGGATLNAFAIAATPPGSVIAGDIVDPAAVAQAVESMVAQFPSKIKSVATALWGSSVIVKRITIPRMDEKVVGDQIRWEAEQYIPFDINEVNLAYTVLRHASQNPDTMDILLVAARQEHVMKYVEVVESAGLQCSVLDVGGFALANCFEANYRSEQGSTIALLNLGASVSNLVLVEGGDVVFCRDLSVGGLTYTNELQKTLSTTSEEAEAMKLSVSSGQPAPDEAAQAVRLAHEMISDEVQASFDFFANTAAASSIRKCYISGGASRTPGLVEHLGKTLNIGVVQFNPFHKVQINGKNLSSAYAEDIKDFAPAAIGLGLRKPGDA